MNVSEEFFQWPSELAFDRQIVKPGDDHNASLAFQISYDLNGAILVHLSFS